MTGTIAIPVGSIWREDDKRARRRIMVVADGRPTPVERHRDFKQVTVRLDAITIVTIDAKGEPAGRCTIANPKRFGKSGGYLLEVGETGAAQP